MRALVPIVFAVGCAATARPPAASPAVAPIDYGVLPEEFVHLAPEPHACVAPDCAVARSVEEAHALGIPEAAHVDFARWMLVLVRQAFEPQENWRERPAGTAYYAVDTPGVVRVPGGCFSPAGGAFTGVENTVLRAPRIDTEVTYLIYSPCNPRLQ